ncbi:MAG: DUF916 domain-containing protein [Actinomycetota bacterium]
MARARRSLAVSALVLAALLVASFPAPAAAVRTVGLSTGTFDFSLAPGQTGEGEVVVSNNGDEDIDVLIYASDQLVAEDGSISYEVPSATQSVGLGTPATWIRMVVGAETKTVGNTPYVSLSPGEQVPVDFQINTPEDVPPGDHQLLIFFEMFSEGDDSGGASASVTGRIGSRIRIRVAGEIVERVDVRPFVTKSFVLAKLAPYTFVVRNEGNIDKDITARILLLDGDLQEVVSSLVTSETPVFAGTNFEQSGAVDTGKQLFGRYTMRLEVSYPRDGSEIGAPEIVTIDKSVWFIPLWLVIALILIIGGIAIWFSWKKAQSEDARERRARRRKYREGHVLVPDVDEVARGDVADAGDAPIRERSDLEYGQESGDEGGRSRQSRRETAPRRRSTRRR